MTDAQREVLMDWVWAAVTLAVGLIATYIIIFIVKRALRKTKMEALLQSFVLSASKVLCIIIVAIIALERVGVNPSSFITVMGVTGAAIALAVKDTLANIAGGIMIIASHPFKAGDFIVIEDNSGYVDQINILRTTLKTYDNRQIEIPNSIISTSVLVNQTAREIRRVDLDVRVEPGTEIRKVQEILEAISCASPMVLDDPAPYFGVRSNIEGYIGIDFFVWCRTEEYWDTHYHMHESIEMALDEAGIKRPANKLEVEIKK